VIFIFPTFFDLPKSTFHQAPWSLPVWEQEFGSEALAA
jgi:hypothetical protein